MKTENGGTEIYCPNCNSFQVCKAINPSKIAYEHGQRWSCSDVHWFRRGRECLSCGTEFLTAEVDEGLVNELLELRTVLSGIKQNAAAYLSESAKASKSLKELTNKLKSI